jgi:transposase
MPKPYDVAFRGRAVAAYEAGEGGHHELADLFGIGYRTLQRCVTQYRATESVTPRPRGDG